MYSFQQDGDPRDLQPYLWNLPQTPTSFRTEAQEGIFLLQNMITGTIFIATFSICCCDAFAPELTKGRICPLMFCSVSNTWQQWSMFKTYKDIGTEIGCAETWSVHSKWTTGNLVWKRSSAEPSQKASVWFSDSYINHMVSKPLWPL